MVDTAQCSIIVFSKLGKELRRWGNRSQSRYPWGITISEDIVYVTNSDTGPLQAFNLQGSYLFEFCPGVVSYNLANICVMDNSLYVTDWDRYIHRFELK